MIETMQTDPVLLDRSRRMRREPTAAETKLWRHLRNRGVAGAKFARQVAVGSYIADFVAREARLIVEVDGETHADPSQDKVRTAALQRSGYRVIRFSNSEVVTNIEGVCAAIAATLAAAPHPGPLPAGEREKFV